MMRKPHLPLAAPFILAALCLPVAVQASSLPKAQYFSATCANCHGTDGYSVGGSVSLAGYDRAKFIETMKAFQTGQRPATLMHQISKGYTDEQIALMADYFSSRKPR